MATVILQFHLKKTLFVLILVFRIHVILKAVSLLPYPQNQDIKVLELFRTSQISLG